MLLFFVSNIILLVCFFASVVDSFSIADFGAIPNVKTWDIAVHNSNAFFNALSQANKSRIDRTVLFPEGTLYYLANSTHDNFQSVHVQVDGTIIFSDDIHKFPLDEGGGGRHPFWQFTNSEFIHLSGTGLLDGQGLNWWRLCYTGNDRRPLLIEFVQSREIVVEGLYLLNSPRYSINFNDCENIVVHDVTIFIDSAITRLHNVSSVMYPLNTDGIDISARNVTIYNTNITNYDDGIVVKPCNQGGRYCKCSQDMMIYNNTINYSVGLSIGSVPPNTDINCVRNIIFKDTYMYRPFKALYIKSNPGTRGTGIVEDITYENILIDQALWWTVWVGPQQQHQPGDGKGGGTGCSFFFPFDPECATQPLVTIRRITFKDIVARNTLPIFEGPGVILCDAANPCTDIVIQNMTNTVFPGNYTDIIPYLPIAVPGVVFPTRYRSDDWQFEYIITNAYGTTDAESTPKVCLEKECFWNKN